MIRHTSAPAVRSLELCGQRVRLATLVDSDYDAWSRSGTAADLAGSVGAATKGAPWPPEDAASFAARCGMRERERQLGTGFGFGIFFEGRFTGEITCRRSSGGRFKTARSATGSTRRLPVGPDPRGCGGGPRIRLPDARLHRIEVAIIPRNGPSRRVVEKLGMRNEGVASAFWRSMASGRTTSATP